MIDTKRFASLISYVTMLIHHHNGQGCLSSNNIEEMMQLSDVSPEVQSLHHIKPEIDGMLHSMFYGRKIDAIKAYRSLTGQGLKESKDIIETFWHPKGE